jgi:hypothetical protein
MQLGLRMWIGQIQMETNWDLDSQRLEHNLYRLQFMLGSKLRSSSVRSR